MRNKKSDRVVARKKNNPVVQAQSTTATLRSLNSNSKVQLECSRTDQCSAAINTNCNSSQIETDDCEQAAQLEQMVCQYVIQTKKGAMSNNEGTVTLNECSLMGAVSPMVSNSPLGECASKQINSYCNPSEPWTKTSIAAVSGAGSALLLAVLGAFCWRKCRRNNYQEVPNGDMQVQLVPQV